jgi:ankyrin repeat protein
MVRLLLENGADIEGRTGNEMAWTALHGAIHEGHYGVVRILLEHGCNPDVEDGFGHPARYWAASKGHEAIVEFLGGK